MTIHRYVRNFLKYFLKPGNDFHPLPRLKKWKLKRNERVCCFWFTIIIKPSSISLQKKKLPFHHLHHLLNTPVNRDAFFFFQEKIYYFVLAFKTIKILLSIIFKLKWSIFNIWAFPTTKSNFILFLLFFYIFQKWNKSEQKKIVKWA